MEEVWLHQVVCHLVVSDWLVLWQLVSAPFLLTAIECRSCGYDVAVWVHCYYYYDLLCQNGSKTEQYSLICTHTCKYIHKKTKKIKTVKRNRIDETGATLLCCAGDCVPYSRLYLYRILSCVYVFNVLLYLMTLVFSALSLLVGRQEEQQQPFNGLFSRKPR